MDKLLDLVLKTPLAKRYLAGFAERAIIVALGAAAGWAGLPDGGDLQADVAKFAAEMAPYVAAAVMFIIAKKRMKKTEVTIAVASASPAGVPRPLVDAHVKAVQATPELPKSVYPGSLIQSVPPGTVDRTD